MTWPTVALGNLATSIRNGLFAKRPTDEPQGSQILRISAVRNGRVNLQDSRFVEGLEPDQIAKFSVRAGDLLITRYNGSRALVGISGIVPPHEGEMIHPDKLIRVVLDRSRVEPKFANYQLGSALVRAHLEPRIRTTAGQSGIAGADVRSIPLVIPPLAEQRRIVDVLEDHLSRLDAAEVSLEMAYKRLEAVWLSFLSSQRRDLLADEQRPIRDIAETALGKMLDAKKHAGTPTRYLRNINVRWGGFDLTDVKSVPLSKDEIDRFQVVDGDVMVCEGGEPGRCAVWRDHDGAIAYQKALHRMRVRPEAAVSPEFLALMLTEAIRSGRSDRLFTGTTIKHLPQEKLRRIEIPVPGMDRQNRVLTRASEFETGLARMERVLTDLKERASALRRSLLTDAFSGRLTGESSDLDHIEEAVG